MMKNLEEIDMPTKKKKEIDLENLTPEEELKLEIAEEIGVLDKVLKGGWGTLSARETGRIGGILGTRNKKKRAQEKKEEQEEKNS